VSSAFLSTSSTDPSTADDRWLSAGRVGKPHGLDGAFHVTWPRIRVLRDAATVTVGGVARTIKRLGGTDEKPTLVLEGVHSREQVDAIRGQDLMIERAAAPPLGDDEWYAEDLAGCRVVDGAVAVGVVEKMLAYPSCELLDVVRDGQPNILVPLIDDAVRSVDIAAKLIDVNTTFLGLAD